MALLIVNIAIKQAKTDAHCVMAREVEPAECVLVKVENAVFRAEGQDTIIYQTFNVACVLGMAIKIVSLVMDQGKNDAHIVSAPAKPTV